eukprot:m.68566 g.68566  ORF g.68566 m.68566 type:complete len:328 (+) comp13914_c0_seq2:91-1074(+)
MAELTLISASNDNTCARWDLQDGEWRRAYCHDTGDSVYGIAVSPDGQRFVASGSDGHLRVWHVDQEQPGQGIPLRTDRMGQAAFGIAWSPCGRFIASASDAFVQLWNPDDGKPLQSLNDCQCDGQVLGGRSYVVVFGSSSDLLLAGATRGRVGVFRAEAEESDAVAPKFTCTAVITPAEDTLYGISLSPCGRYLVTGSSTNRLSCWDLQESVTVGSCTKATDWIRRVAICPSGDLVVAASADSSIRVYEMPSLKLLRVLKYHTRAVWGVSFNEAGDMMCAGSWDKRVSIWSVPDFELLHSYEAHSNCVYEVRFVEGMVLQKGAGKLM